MYIGKMNDTQEWKLYRVVSKKKKETEQLYKWLSQCQPIYPYYWKQRKRMFDLQLVDQFLVNIQYFELRQSLFINDKQSKYTNIL